MNQSIEIQKIPTDSIYTDPRRFQFKIGYSATGTTGSLSDIKTWNPLLAGVLLVWWDDHQHKLYAVNGHNRLSKAKQLGVQFLWVRLSSARTADEAKAEGALMNIAEGRGDIFDAATFFRQSGIGQEELNGHGISMGGYLASAGTQIATLAPHLFEKFRTGRLAPAIAAALGEASMGLPQELAHMAQHQAHIILQRKPTATKDVARELVIMAAQTPMVEIQQQGLLGDISHMSPVALEKAEIISYVRKRLQQERRIFELGSQTRAAGTLTEVGNLINTDRNRTEETKRFYLLQKFERERMLVGPINDILNDAAQQLHDMASGKGPFKDQIYKSVISAMERPQLAYKLVNK
jgi:hypothetical protein